MLIYIAYHSVSTIQLGLHANDASDRITMSSSNKGVSPVLVHCYLSILLPVSDRPFSTATIFTILSKEVALLSVLATLVEFGGLENLSVAGEQCEVVMFKHL